MKCFDKQTPQIAYNINKKKYYMELIKNSQKTQKINNQDFRTVYQSIFTPNKIIIPY